MHTCRDLDGSEESYCATAFAGLSSVVAAYRHQSRVDSPGTEVLHTVGRTVQYRVAEEADTGPLVGPGKKVLAEAVVSIAG